MSELHRACTCVELYGVNGMKTGMTVTRGLVALGIYRCSSSLEVEDFILVS